MPRTLRFSRSLYLPEAVQAAAEVYGAVAGVVVDVQAEEVLVHIDADAGYGEQIFDAFGNHALFETVLRSREQLGGRL